MRYAILTGLLLGIMAMVSCQKGSDNKSVENEMYEPSELALVMRSMEAQLKDIEVQLESGKLPIDSFSAYVNLHTAEATNPREINETYHGMADVFMANAKEMNAQKTIDDYKIHYDLLVNNCISCHQVYCNGPIERISKLRLKAIQ